MTSYELIANIQKNVSTKLNYQFSQKEVRYFLESLGKTLSDAFEIGDTLYLPGIGRFKVQIANPRKYFDVKTQKCEWSEGTAHIKYIPTLEIKAHLKDLARRFFRK